MKATGVQRMIEDVLENREQWHVETGACLEVLRRLPDSCVDLAVTSPPYWNLREYGTASWDGGDPNCDHKVGGQVAQTKWKKADTVSTGVRPGSGKKCKKCGAVRVDKQIGQEETPEEYIVNLVAVFAEVRRVLKPWGTCWLNLGDSWASDSKWGGQTGGKHVKELHGESSVGRDRKNTGLKQGDMVGIPWRTALALQAAGWWLRSDNLWLKVSAMPLSVKGWRWERCRIKVKSQKNTRKAGQYATGSGNSTARPHSGGFGNVPEEYQTKWKDCPGCDKCSPNGGYVLRRGSWRTTPAHEYLFMLAKSGRYFADGFAVRQQLAAATILRDRYSRVLDDPDEQYAVAHDHETVSNLEQGANLRSFHVLRGENFSGDHYAVFPIELPALAIRCGTSEKGICNKCGSPYVRVLKHVGQHQTQWAPGTQHKQAVIDPNRVKGGLGGTGHVQDYETIDWRPSCTCKKADKVPALVLDPFSGSGTSGLACLRTGRRYLGIELNEQYADDSRYRLRTRGHAVRKPKREGKKEKGLFRDGNY